MDLKLIDRILALGNLIGQAKLAYIEANTDLQVSSWNKGAAQLFGYTEDETMGHFLDELTPLTKRELINCKTTQFITTEVKRGDKTIQCEIFYAPIQSTKGEKFGVAVLAKDISARIKEKATLKRHRHNLTQIFEFAPIGFFHVNSENNIISSNPEYAWMMGYESSTAVVEQVSDFYSQTFFDTERSEEFKFAINEAGEVIRFRARLKRKDNSFVWALCYAKATQDESGRRNGFNGFAIDISETVRAEQELKKVNEKLKMLSVIDGLTQIPNRRKFDDYLGTEWNRHYRNKETISLILSDIDFFKLYNDNYGHQAGDDCLIQVAKSIQTSASRSSDLAARYGGEEFAIVLPHTDAKGAMVVAETIRKNVQELMIPHEDSKVNGYISLSLGVATATPNSHNSAEGLIAMADQALYEAKEKGRNQCVQKLEQ